MQPEKYEQFVGQITISEMEELLRNHKTFHFLTDGNGLLFEIFYGDDLEHPWVITITRLADGEDILEKILYREAYLELTHLLGQQPYDISRFVYRNDNYIQ